MDLLKLLLEMKAQDLCQKILYIELQIHDEFDGNLKDGLVYKSILDL